MRLPLIALLLLSTASANEVESTLDELLQKRRELESGHLTVTQSFAAAPEPPQGSIRKTETSSEIWFEGDYRRIDQTIIGVTPGGNRSRGFQQLIVTPTQVIFRDSNTDPAIPVLIYPKDAVDGYRAEKLAIRPRFLLLSVAHPIPTSFAGNPDTQLFGHLYLDTAAPVIQDQVITSQSDHPKSIIQLSNGLVRQSEFVSGDQILRLTIRETDEHGFPVSAIYEELSNDRALVSTEYQTEIYQFNEDVPDHIFQLGSLDLPVGKTIRERPDPDSVVSTESLWDGERIVPNPEFQNSPAVSIEQQSQSKRSNVLLWIINGVVLFLVVAWMFHRRSKMV